MINIYDCPQNLRDYKYVVYRTVNGTNRYYGAANDVEAASKIQGRLGKNGIVTEVKNIIAYF